MIRKLCKCGCGGLVNEGREYIRGHSSKKYSLNENYFKKIDSQEKAYFLGFMFADGNISKKQNQCRITLQRKDKYMLEKFQKLLETNEPLSWVKQNKAWKLSFTSPKIKQDLINHGCMPCKTFKIEFPLWLRENLKPHFIRGFVDGDGSISIQFVNNHKQKQLRVKISGRENFLKNILSLSNIRGHIYKYDYHVIYHLHFLSSFAITFCNWLYKDASIFLERKRNKYLEYLSWRKEYEKSL